MLYDVMGWRLTFYPLSPLLVLNEIRPKLISCSHNFKCRPRLSQWNSKEGNITIFHFYVASSAVTLATASCNTYDTPNLYNEFLSMTQQSHMFINWHVYIPGTSSTMCLHRCCELHTHTCTYLVQINSVYSTCAEKIKSINQK